MRVATFGKLRGHSLGAIGDLTHSTILPASARSVAGDSVVDPGMVRWFEPFGKGRLT